MRKKSLTILLTLILLLFFKGASFADISVSVLVDKQKTSIDDIIYLSVSVSGIRSADKIPEVSGGDDFDVSYRGSSSNISMINGRVTSNVDFNFVLEPKRVGTFQLPPVSYEYKGELYKAAPIKLTITKASQQSTERNVFVKAQVSDSSPYVNEQIIYTFKFYAGAQIANPTYDTPKFNNFIVEELGNVSRYQETIEGKVYRVNEVRFALFPLKSGEYTIPPIKAKVDVVVQTRRRGKSSFFSMFDEYKTVRLRTEEVKLDVRPLPAYDDKNIPFSNLIGDFKVKASLGKRKLNVNDSTTLTVTVHGLGNIKAGVLPDTSDPEYFKTYDDKPAENVRVTKRGIYGSKTFKRAFIPLKEGNITIPAIKFAFFDTKKDKYVIFGTPEYRLDVSPSLEQEKLNLVEMVGRTTTKEAVKIIGRDILPINTSLDSLKNDEIKIRPTVNIVILILPCFAYVAFVLYLKRAEKHETDKSILKRKRAFKKFKHAACNLNKLIKDDKKDFYGRLLNSFKIYLGDKFNLAGGAMTINELSRILSEKRLHKDTTDSITDAMKELERAQFASVELSQDEKKRLFKALTSAAKKIEKKLG
jgi:hypothetical protein